jgi:hypothetical protein
MLLTNQFQARRNKKWKTNQILTTTLALLTFAAVANATNITITFDPSQATPPGQTGAPPAAETPANTLSYWGITFSSSEPDNSDICGGTAPLCFSDAIGTAALGLTYLTDNVLSGSLDPVTGTGTLTLSFATPTNILDFGALVGTNDTEPLSVALSGPQFTGQSPQVINLQIMSGYLDEGEFSYSGSPITKAVITFTSDESPIFAIDNLTYDPPAVPEPKSFVLFSLGSLLIYLGAGSTSFGEAKRSRT